MIWAQGGQVRVVFDVTIVGSTIVSIEMIADPERLAQLDIVPLTKRAVGQRGQPTGSDGTALARTTSE